MLRNKKFSYRRDSVGRGRRSLCSSRSFKVFGTNQKPACNILSTNDTNL